MGRIAAFVGHETKGAMQMKKLLGTIAIGIAAVMLVAGPAAADTGADEMLFAQKLNELRVSQGLQPLAIKGELFDMARGWSRSMAAAGAISHNPSLAAQAPTNWLKLGENVGMGPDVQSLHDAFVASPSHYANMVNPAFDSVGVGVVESGGVLFVSVEFMTTAPTVQPTATAGKKCTKNRRGKTVCRKVRSVRRR
jgi:uncharacterized protein YkwD